MRVFHFQYVPSRHSYAVHLLTNGILIKQVQTLMGHKRRLRLTFFWARRTYISRHQARCANSDVGRVW
ncbi:hypothetical protein DVH07_18275 [Hafnia paralvei]|nr:hypothetical protein DU449_17835 [Hafnia paralvei]RDA62958.1 hypothetical protein DVH08_20045 [Hafnia paralvei]RDA63798.1 hypothetical protein DVH09_18405 [Hafnia paralvei]RDA75084.1 hypothetical protein DVH10_17575 [Hafnia paralvei]RDA75488.1 hypothetical protein DVH07_18275 [Hafnia paralvei]